MTTDQTCHPDLLKKMQELRKLFDNGTIDRVEFERRREPIKTEMVRRASLAIRVVKDDRH